MGTPATPNWDSLIPIDPALQQSQPQSQTQSPAAQYTAYTAYTQGHYSTAYQQQYQSNTVRQNTESNATTSNDATKADTPVQPAASTSRVTLDRTRNGPLNPNFDPDVLKPRLAAIATHHKLAGGVPDVAASYIALALRKRLERLVQQMSVAARQRTDTQFDRPALYSEGLPMWSIVVRSDVAKQVAVLERIEREEETKVRRERKERAEMTAAQTAALAAQAAAGGAGMDFDDDGEGGKRKKKKDGPGVTARNMSEDVRKKMSNAVASQAAGIGGKYSWMNATNAAAAAAKPIKSTSASSTPAATPATSSTTATPGSGWARAYVPKKAAATPALAPEPVEEDTRTAITIRDAQFVVEKERGGGRAKG
ncbi:transcription initiation factor TFIID component TAF4 family-domain-containing protein [Mycena pura]|uniref:Transcription initiation factor TFIID subunit 4 n=1 Tax=Mycena pura TaxID=153505 RepID=A0AAD6V5B0_9AGAR|nr:transcription initiation factor TFIID component TAF4 family-domain-containing protein [Mycena pura]